MCVCMCKSMGQQQQQSVVAKIRKGRARESLHLSVKVDRVKKANRYLGFVRIKVWWNGMGWDGMGFVAVGILLHLTDWAGLASSYSINYKMQD